MASKILRWALSLAVIGIVGFFGWKTWSQKQASQLPTGIVSGNGRIESIQVDVAAKYGGRIDEIAVKEGDLVDVGQVLAKIDISELTAERAKGRAKIAEAKANVAQVNADIIKQKSELKYAQAQLKRAAPLVESKTITKEEFERKQTLVETADATLKVAEARLDTAEQTVKANESEVDRIQAQIDESILKSPVRGRVLYKLAEQGEVLAQGGKALTLINLGDIYMEIFLPSQDAARVRIGADARIKLDARPEYSAIAKVSFVSPEAQFTPKQVETLSERDKLMFRVKLQIPSETVLAYIQRIKTGVRGVGYVKLDESIPWPESFEKRFPKPDSEDSAPVKSAEKASST